MVVVAVAVGAGISSLRGQDVVIEDPLPILQPTRDFMAKRPLVQLGSVNKYLSGRHNVTTPYNTTMMVYDPLMETPEVEEVTLAMIEPEVTLQMNEPWLKRAWRSVGNFFSGRTE